MTKLQFVPGVKCKWSKEGDDKKSWKIEEIYFNPKLLDFAGDNRKTIHDRFQIHPDHIANIANSQKHKAVVNSDYFCLELKLMI